MEEINLCRKSFVNTNIRAIFIVLLFTMPKLRGGFYMLSKIKISHSVISTVTLLIFILIVALLGGSIMYMKKSINAEQAAVMRKEEFKQLGIDLADASDYLTDEARKFAVTNDVTYMHKYWEEINVTKTRDKVIYKIIELNTPTYELSLLAEAKKNSDGLVETEKRSMKLIIEALKVPESSMPSEVSDFHLSSKDQSLSKEEKLQKAREIMFDAKYDADKKTIMNPIENFQKSINNISELELESARKARVQAETLQIILSFIIILAIALLLRIIFTQLTIPVNSYTEALVDLNFNNNKFTLIPRGSKELRTLADNFNKMYYSLQDELIKRKKAEETMKMAKEEAEMANKAKSQFLANMSHEIRTPLNAIIGYEYMLSNTALTNEQEGCANKIGISAKNLLGIINNILDFSKIEAKKLMIELVPFNISSILGELSSMVYFEVKRKGLKFNFSIDPDVPEYLRGDPVRLKQIILNLLSNGIKFTASGGLNITVKLIEKIEEQVTVEFRVADTGIGITEEQKKFLFEPFKQGDTSTTRKYGGTGLGLSISKELVELMGGEIYLESEFGKGTTFCFTLKFQETEEILAEKNKDNDSVNGIFRNNNVLLVEDNIINLEMTKEILENFGLKTDTASSGMLAIDKVKNNTYDVILMDIQMPNMDGYETTANIRKIKGAEILPIIALSADVVDGVIKKIKGAGMNDYLTKPLNIDSLVNVLKNYIKLERSSLKNWLPVWKSDEHCIDYKSAIERIGGKNARYKKILEQFIRNHSEDAKKLYSYTALENWEAAKALVHTMKGIAGNIGAKKLMTHCTLTEKAIIKKDKERLLFLVKDFEILLEKVIDCGKKIIVNILNEESTSNEKIYTKNIEESIVELINLLQAGDAEAKDVFAKCKDYFINKMGEKAYSKLNRKISDYAFEEAYDNIIQVMNGKI